MKCKERIQSSLLGSASPLTPLSPSSSQAFFFALVIGALTQPVAFADSPKISDSELAWRYHCTTCHGSNGIANSDRYPNLAGQNPLYIESRLKSFRAKDDPRNLMNAQAAGLSDEEIARLAAYFSQGGGP